MICAIELFVIIMLNVSIVYLYFVNKQKFRIRRARGAKQPKFLLRNYWNNFGCQVQSFWAISSVTWLSHSQSLGFTHGKQANYVHAGNFWSLYHDWSTEIFRFILTSHQNYATYTKMIVFLTSLNVVGVEPIRKWKIINIW